MLLVLGSVLGAGGLHAVASADGLGFGSGGGAAAGEEDSFERRPYIALGAGVTRLEPESPSPALTVSEDISAGVELGVGYDFTRWLSGELHVADLGAADIAFLGTEVGDVGYRVWGATGIAYLFGTRDGFIPFGSGRGGASRHEGLSLFGRFGIGGMSNDSDLDYDRDHTTHAVFGAGLEYGFRNGVALRAELQGFDTDASYVGLSVLKRFGDASASKPVSPGLPVEPAAALPLPVTPEPEQEREPLIVRQIVPPYVYFAFDKAELSAESLAKLDAFVDEVADSELDIAIGGHTDSTGTERYNEGLSDRRADVVRDYLISRGIVAERMRASGYGESRPISSNLTREGRAQNRRTEMRLE